MTDPLPPDPTPEHVQSVRENTKLHVPVGWHSLVDQLFDRFPYVAIGNGPTFWSKWGTLRCRGPWEAYYKCIGLDAFIHEIEIRSEERCEKCGALGWLRPTGWRQTLCDAHTPPEVLEQERLDGTRPSDALIQEMTANPDAMSRWI